MTGWRGGCGTVLLSALLLSGCSSRHAPAPVVTLSEARTFKQFKELGNATEYQVEKGDTLFSIAWYSGNDYKDLARINKLSAPYAIYPGQVLKLRESNKKSKKVVTKRSGQTSKIKANQPVDPPKKQAYGESKTAQKSTTVTKKNTQRMTASDFPAQVTEWTWPTRGKVVGQFSLSEQGNKGIDIANSSGTPILASAAGKVVYTGNALRGFGNLIIIKHTDAYLTAYAHNRKILVKEQDWVRPGQHIAEMGSSGTSQTMLHFEIRYKGKSVDPLRFLPNRP
ncbi:peptidoglycan DD-metalloendopeptidase family protein [Bowmanella pacifica]|uniref:peptidoglycan DD-metalloendopeptidase family protein n=1 Tax=Bowmanella pacifica TaxID=502051 RepID=UPI0016687E0E|nr:peptidoglycan DD-metalloendopeptidase family protein [Bowmanella pacifica]